MAAAHWVKLNEVRAAMKRLPDHVRGRLQKTVEVTAFQVARLAESKAPRRTGKLRASIQWKAMPSTITAKVSIHTDAFYWKFFEYGTEKMGARPFVRPAKEAMAADHEHRYQQALDQSLTQMESEAK